MALKELITEQAAITEQRIEEIVSDYVGYDIHEKVVVHRPAFAKLSNKGKVLVHLVAMQGWRYVTEGDVPGSASPADLGKALYIPGGTLRPVLKVLKDRHMIVTSGKKYLVSAPALDDIKTEIAGRGGGQSAPRKRRAKRRSSTSNASNESGGKPKKGRSRNRGRSRAARFVAWIDNGFFDVPKTTKQVHGRFHKEGVIIPMTSVPKYLLKALSDDRLERDKKEMGGKLVWAWKTKKSPK